MKLDLEGIEVVSFEVQAPEDTADVAAVSGTVCITRPTVYDTCCTL